MPAGRIKKRQLFSRAMMRVACRVHLMNVVHNRLMSLFPGGSRTLLSAQTRITQQLLYSTEPGIPADSRCRILGSSAFGARDDDGCVTRFRGLQHIIGDETERWMVVRIDYRSPSMVYTRIRSLLEGAWKIACFPQSEASKDSFLHGVLHSEKRSINEVVHRRDSESRSRP